MEFKLPHVLALSSIIIGANLLITSSLLIKEWGPIQRDYCKVYPGAFLCDWMRIYIAAGSLGIICGVLQIASVALAWFKKWKIWCGIHAFSFLTMLIAFSLAIDKHLDDVVGDDKIEIKSDLFLIFSGIDWIFCLGATIGVFLLTKSEKGSS